MEENFFLSPSHSIKLSIHTKGVFTLSVALCHQQQATTDRIASNFVSHVKQL
jgi:hypothetical protein